MEPSCDKVIFVSIEKLSNFILGTGKDTFSSIYFTFGNPDLLKRLIPDMDLDWKHISEYDFLDESFIRDFQEYVDWELIFKHQTLTEDFKREFAYKLE